jgi:hypothetical protein
MPGKWEDVMGKAAESSATTERSTARHLFRLVKDIPREREWQQELTAVLERGVQTTEGVGVHAIADGSVPIIMCLWNRPERIRGIISMLEALDGKPPVRLVLWNNNADDADFYAGVVREWHDRNRTCDEDRTLRSIDLINSPKNFGGLGRFLAARLMWNDGYRGPIVTLDDDQDVSPRFIRDLERQWTPRSIVPWWGFRLHGSYWRRSEIEPGTTPDHAGTGGTMLDVALVGDDRFFARLPHRYAYLEDQWMSFFAQQEHWRITKARTDITLVSEEKNQYHGLKPLKDVFYVWQRTVGAFWLRLPHRRRAGWARGRITGADDRFSSTGR